MRRPKASDIDDEAAVRAVWELSGHGDRWVMCWEVDEAFPDFPPKVVQAKLSRLMHRGFIDGCDCGCRGDWHLRQKGAEFIGVTLRPDHSTYGADALEARRAQS